MIFLVTYHDNENLLCYTPTAPPLPMQATTLDDAKVECSNDATCTRFYSRCADSPDPPSAQEYYRCETASLIGSSGCKSRLYDKDAKVEGTIISSLISMLNKWNPISNELVTIFFVHLLRTFDIECNGDFECNCVPFNATADICQGDCISGKCQCRKGYTGRACGKAFNKHILIPAILS